MTVKIVTDSTADLTAAEAEAAGVHVVPLSVSFGSETFADGVTIFPSEFYRRLVGASAPPKTSQPATGAFQQLYEELLKDGSEVVSIHISGKLSGTLNAVQTARAALADPERVSVVDSGTVSAALAQGVLAAAHIAQRGGTAAEAVGAARSALDRSRLICLLDTLEYLQKGGRIGRARAWIGGLLSVKPIIAVVDGEVVPLERVRSRARGLDRILELTVGQPDIEQIVTFHSSSADFDRFIERLRAAAPNTPIRTGLLGPVVGTYAGPGAIGTVVVRRAVAGA